ncbi:Reticulon-like protein [Schizosaccharomyces pombe]|uniref:Reticulon-like protein 1 n=1 Tax=Schizosaccharomyces pombe (strain 972 / ATCC 24843) TaxID=284812 RepID=RTN1_SCHPO|nr:reticulon-like protein Rtn1 [Schizosaccharomyces pombe]P53694.1 RecName: Full=Reticulon-like protein 1; AltName: Full=Cell lysis protein cwl1 [Schizosaccharomyces pombe 972h-]CAA64219.1 cwl1 [Schizosaccharomyces pombe]CAB37626.1 reticulon-like protein Rtn1 [Schizosaccharomyces pombe]|eukprot:NP_001018789.2 reticulon-like protein Rtn1 [Schizosaccharomyces pombe]
MSEQHSLNPFESGSVTASDVAAAKSGAEDLVNTLTAHTVHPSTELPSATSFPSALPNSENPVIQNISSSSSEPHHTSQSTPGETSSPVCPVSGAHGGADKKCPALEAGCPFTNTTKQNVDPEISNALWSVLTWKNTSCSFSTLMSILALVYVPSWINLPRLFFRTFRYVFLITSIIEFGGLFASNGKRGVLSHFRSSYITCDSKALDRIVNSIVDIFNVMLIQFQRILFAESPILTFTASVAAFIEFFLSGFLSYKSLFVWNVLFAFILPRLYVCNERSIKHLVASLERSGDKLKKQATETINTTVNK